MENSITYRINIMRQMYSTRFSFYAGFLLSVFFCHGLAFGLDWPTYLHDNARSGITEESLSLPLKDNWVYRSIHEPCPAWPAPAKRDYWHKIRKLRPLNTFDRAFHVTSADGAVCFGSTADDKIYCLDAETGAIRWTFFTEGPVRFAPTFSEGNVYACSDDGWVYCLRVKNGSLVWKHRPGPKDHRLPGNGRMISLWPIRSGVLVDNGVLYCFGGHFPTQGVYRCALSADDGAVIWNEQINGISPQGYMLASANRLFVPTGRTTPAIIDRSSGNHVGNFSGQGGAYALLTEDTLLNGPGRTTGALGLSNANTKEQIASFDGLRMIVHRGVSYMLTETELIALDRDRYVESAQLQNQLTQTRGNIEKRLRRLNADDDEERKQLVDQLESVKKNLIETANDMKDCFLWRKSSSFPYALILAGDTLFAGGENMVAAFRTRDGVEIWNKAVTGRAYGLSVANGNLFVSTDHGLIYCFSEGNLKRRGYTGSYTGPNPFSEGSGSSIQARMAERIGRSVQKGYCLVLGDEEGRLAYELAKRTDLRVIVLEDDPLNVAACRKNLDRLGLYGTRVSVHHGSLEVLPYVNYFANAIVSGRISGSCPTSAEEVYRVLRPCGGIAYLGQAEATETAPADLKAWLTCSNVEGDVIEEDGAWAVIKRGPIPGSGEWTHLYAEPGNSACSMDLFQGPAGIQWYGQPGPRNIVDRHHRPMSPLYKNGRLFVSGDDRIIATDAYNGAFLWEKSVPYSRRIGVLKDCGYFVATEEYLYIASENKCQAVKVEDGSTAMTVYVPQELKGSERDWGYVAIVDDQLFGSATKIGASFYENSEETCDILEGDFREMIFCDSLFSMNRHTGDLLWTYQNGAIFNNTIAIGDGRIYCVESRNETTMNDQDGRISAHQFCGGETYLVALDLKSGNKLWEQPYHFPFEHIMFLSYAEKTLLTVGTYNVDKNVRYGLFAFESETGQFKWKTNYIGQQIGGSHGEQWQHPVIIGSKIISRPYEYDLFTGEKGTYQLDRGGHGCGGLSACASYLFGRGGNPRMYEIHEGNENGSPLTLVNRPGCWINIIPAGGLILLPESSSGCTCAYPMQLSIAFTPKVD